jgi:hypothetical protein
MHLIKLNIFCRLNQYYCSTIKPLVAVEMARMMGETRVVKIKEKLESKAGSDLYQH